MRFTSRFILLVAVYFTATNFLFAQITFTNSPSDSVYKIGKFEDVEVLSIHQINTSNDSLVLRWKKISAIVPNNWDANVCDNSTCYTSLLDSGIMNPIMAGDYGFLILHITPHINNGIAIIKYAVWDTANASLIDTLTFILKVEQGLNSNTINNDEIVFVNPNPMVDFVTINTGIKNIESIKIADLNGKYFSEFNLQLLSFDKKLKLDLSNLKNGIYFLIVTIDKATIIKKILKQ